MTFTRKTNPASGFTLIELLVTLSILMVLMMMSAPPLMKYIQRNKIMSAVQQTSAIMRLARIRAIKNGAFAVIQIQPTAKPPLVISFVDLNRNLILDANEMIPSNLSKVQLEKGVTFLEWNGFTPDPNSSTLPPLAVFTETGSMDSGGVYPGYYRFTDIKGNELEVRIAQSTTGRIEIRKKEGSVWVTAGEGGSAWTWK
jgi:prepilin-type N-terminal cleavage/methylation domain-containing protein